MLDVITIFNPREIDSIHVTLARLLNFESKQETSTSTSKVSTNINAATASGNFVEAKTSEMTREEFLAQKITVLRIEQNLLSILQKNGIRTMADYLAQTEESFSMMKAKNGMAYTARFLQLQGIMKRKLESL